MQIALIDSSKDGLFKDTFLPKADIVLKASAAARTTLASSSVANLRNSDLSRLSPPCASTNFLSPRASLSLASFTNLAIPANRKLASGCSRATLYGNKFTKPSSRSDITFDEGHNNNDARLDDLLSIDRPDRAWATPLSHPVPSTDRNASRDF